MRLGVMKDSNYRNKQISIQMNVRIKMQGHLQNQQHPHQAMSSQAKPKPQPLKTSLSLKGLHSASGQNQMSSTNQKHARKNSQGRVTQEGQRKIIRDFNISDAQGRNFDGLAKADQTRRSTLPGHATAATAPKSKNAAIRGAADTGGSKNEFMKKVKRRSTSSSHDHSFNLIENAPDEKLELDHPQKKQHYQTICESGSNKVAKAGGASMERTLSQRNVKVSQKPISVTSINLSAQLRQVSKRRFNRTTNNSFAADKFSNMPCALPQHSNQRQTPKAGMQPGDAERGLASPQSSAAITESLGSTATKQLGLDYANNPASGRLETQTSHTTNRFGANPQEDRIYTSNQQQISRPFDKAIVTQEDESVLAMGQSDPSKSSEFTTGRQIESAWLQSSSGGSALDRRNKTALAHASSMRPGKDPDSMLNHTKQMKKLQMAGLAETNGSTGERAKTARSGAAPAFGSLSTSTLACKLKGLGMNQPKLSSRGQASKERSTKQVAKPQTGSSLHKQTSNMLQSLSQQSFVQRANQNSSLAGNGKQGQTPSGLSLTIKQPHSLSLRHPKVCATTTKAKKADESIATDQSICLQPDRSKGRAAAQGSAKMSNANSAKSSVIFTPLPEFSNTSQSLSKANSISVNDSKLKRKKSLNRQQQRNSLLRLVATPLAETTVLSVEQQASLHQADVLHKHASKTSLNNYMGNLNPATHKPSYLKSANQLGSISLSKTSRKSFHDESGEQETTMQKKINVSTFNSHQSLKVLNQSSCLSSSKKAQSQQQLSSYMTQQTAGKKSSLKKQQVLKKVPQTSSFLSQGQGKKPQADRPGRAQCKVPLQARQKAQKEASRPKATGGDPQPTMAAQPEKKQTTVRYRPLSNERYHLQRMAAPPKQNSFDGGAPGYGSSFAALPGKKSSTALNFAPCGSQIRSSSCSGASKAHTQLGRAADSKPKTKCSFTQLKIIRQKDSESGSTNEQASISRHSINNTVTYSSNPSATKPCKANKSAKNQKISVNAIGNYGRITTSSNQVFNPVHRYDTQGSAQANRQSGKEILSSLGQTPSASHFDLSNGLPTCLRHEAPFKLGLQQDNSETTIVAPDETSFNDIKQALLDGQPEDGRGRDEDNQGQDESGMVGPYSLPTITNILHTDSNASEPDHTSGQRVNAQYLNDFLRGHQRPSAIRSGEEEAIIHNEYIDRALDVEFPEAKAFAEFEQRRQLPQQHRLEESQKAAHPMGSQLQQQINLQASQNGLAGSGSNQYLMSSFLTYEGLSTSQKGQPHLQQSTLSKNFHNMMTESNIRSQAAGATTVRDSQGRRRKETSSAILSSNRRQSGTCSGDEPLWTLSDEAGDTTDRMRVEGCSEVCSEQSAARPGADQADSDADKTFDEMEATEDSKKYQDLISLHNLQSSHSSRPSIDQMLPTRHSQLEIDSQKSLSNVRINQFGVVTSAPGTSCHYNNFTSAFNSLGNNIIFGEGGRTPPTGGYSNLQRKQRQLEEQMQRQQYVSEATQEQDLEQADSSRSYIDSSHFRNSEAISPDAALGDDEQSAAHPTPGGQARAADGFPRAVEYSESPGAMINYTRRDREKLVVSVLEGLEGGIVDQQMADKWVHNDDDFRPQVIADDSEGEASSSGLGDHAGEDQEAADYPKHEVNH